MSRLQDLGKDAEKLSEVLEEYEKALDGVEKIIEIKGKKLEHANRENPAWQLFYDQKKIELYTIVKYLELQVNRVRGKAFIRYTETYNRELSDRAKDKYIDNEAAVLAWNELYLEAKELYDKYASVVDAFKTRGYALNNITKIRVVSMEETIV